LLDAETDAYRMVHSASDGWPGWYVDKLGEFVLSQSEFEVTEEQLQFLKRISDARRLPQGAQSERPQNTSCGRFAQIVIGRRCAGTFHHR
jgi:23S rRNA G2069 N7-methylase RlmK/C1962 C5-methylase RlmI